jgi:hypothetical protein
VITGVFPQIVLGPLLAFGSLGPIGIGVLGLIRSIRAARRVKTHPWVARTASYRLKAVSIRKTLPGLLVNASAEEPEAVCFVLATTSPYRSFPQGDDLPILIAGDPQECTVATTPDKRELLVIKRPHSQEQQQRLRGYATGQ